jgi:hypothetical protein
LNFFKIQNESFKIANDDIKMNQLDKDENTTLSQMEFNRKQQERSVRQGKGIIMKNLIAKSRTQ